MAALFLTEDVKDADFVETLQRAVPDLADAGSGGLEVEGLPHLEHVVLIGGESVPGVIVYEKFLERSGEVSDEELRERPGPGNMKTFAHCDTTNGH